MLLRRSELLGGGAIYGISRQQGIASAIWTRTDSSIKCSSDPTPQASDGSSIGQSWFDDKNLWKNIVRENINGNIMVCIPAFYYLREVKNGVEYIKISSSKHHGFSLHPAFLRNGKINSKIYIGAYETSSNNQSVTNANPQVSQTRATFRTNARALNGTGLNNWSQYDISTVSAIQMLYLVEYAHNDIQYKIGYGNCSTSAAIKTGTCDNLNYHTGRIGNASNKSSGVLYRNIENFWSNIWEWCDGLNFINGQYWYTNNPINFADDTTTNYNKCSYDGSTGWSNTLITRLGYDSKASWFMMPDAASGSSSTSNNSYMSDSIWSATGNRVFKRSGYWDIGSSAGLFASIVYDASSYASTHVGSRLQYIPNL